MRKKEEYLHFIGPLFFFNLIVFVKNEYRFESENGKSAENFFEFFLKIVKKKF